MKRFIAFSLFMLLAVPLFSQGTNPMINYTALKAELVNDPNGYGYAPYLADFNPVELAAMLNLVRDGSGGFAAIVVKRIDIDPQEILEAVDIADFLSTATAFQIAWFTSLTQSSKPISLLYADGVTENRIYKNLKTLIPTGGNGSRGRIVALSQKNGSRIEQLFGTGVTVNYQDVIDAIRNF